MIRRADHIGAFAYIQVVSHIKFKILVVKLGKLPTQEMDEHIRPDIVQACDVEARHKRVDVLFAIKLEDVFGERNQVENIFINFIFCA